MAGKKEVSMLVIDTASITGRRARNEDAVAAVVHHSKGTPLAAAIVCDGVGRWRDSDQTANAAALAGIMRFCSFAAERDGTPLDDHEMTAVLHAVLDSALEATGGGPGATTFVASVVTPWAMGLIWVGDSKAYLIRDGRAVLLSRPHTLEERLVDEGEPTHRVMHERNVLSQALCRGATPAPGMVILPPRAGDRYLLASDGLDVLDRATLAASVTRPVERLVNAAVDAGSTDNVTAARIDGVAPRPTSAGRWWAMADACHQKENPS
jgi:serine/threonine protein phosphatase PrpC